MAKLCKATSVSDSIGLCKSAFVNSVILHTYCFYCTDQSLSVSCIGSSGSAALIYLDLCHVKLSVLCCAHSNPMLHFDVPAVDEHVCWYQTYIQWW